MVKYICDGCGKEKNAVAGRFGWSKPDNWFSRTDDDGPQDACSRECIQDVAEKTGKSDLVLPI